MNAIKPAKITEIAFEPRDVEIFKIPDTKTKIATVQNYFFPRLEILLRHTLDIIQSVYNINPYRRMTFVYRPSNRKNAKQNYDFEEAYIGISGKRRTDRPLTIRHPDGKPFFFHPTYLTYNIRPEGNIRVELLPFRQLVDERFVESVARLVQENIEPLTPILALNHISYTSAHNFVQLKDAFTVDEIGVFGIKLFSPSYHFPIDLDRGLSELVIAFVALYPLVDSFIAIGEGETPQLSKMLEQFKAWWLSSLLDRTSKTESTEVEPSEQETPQIPQLDSYSFVRAGLWWDVLARDNWRCCKCGRSAKEDGVILHVDHIKPRSKGGTDDMDNLQTLCRKCNLGKSDKYPGDCA